MKITVTVDDKVHQADTPYEGADYVLVKDVTECPLCGHSNGIVCGVPLKFKVRGRGKHVESHDTYAAEAVSLCCQQRVGTIRVKMSTIFGVEEDNRVLSGPWRVY